MVPQMLSEELHRKFGEKGLCVDPRSTPNISPTEEQNFLEISLVQTQRTSIVLPFITSRQRKMNQTYRIYHDLF